MQMRSLIAAVLFTAASTTAVLAQSPAASGAPARPVVAPTPPEGGKLAGTTPADCLKSGSAWFSKSLLALPVEDRTAARPSYTTEYRRLVKECGASFRVEDTPIANLGSLSSYYTFVGDTMNARRSIDRALASMNSTSISDAERGAILLLALDRAVGAEPGYFGILKGAERVVAQIDALPASESKSKIAAHQRMLGQYGYLDVADGLQQHAEALIKLGRETQSPAVLVSAFESLARASADKLHPQDALKILYDAEQEVGTANVKGRYDDFRRRYALIGTAAPAVTGKWWVNNKTPLTAVTPGNGSVTLVEFTAHWCGPCKNSYPGIKKVAEHFAGRAFNGVMVTGIYGYLGQQRPLTPEQEVAADAEYFGKEHALPFPVAINVDAPATGADAPYPAPVVDRAYRVSGIPQIIIIDKKGVIRQIVTGWDQGNTERFIAYIEQLLAEK